MSEAWEGIHRLVIVAERPSTRGKEGRIDNGPVLRRVVLTTTCIRTRAIRVLLSSLLRKLLEIL
jgi:hypothetical protein